MLTTVCAGRQTVCRLTTSAQRMPLCWIDSTAILWSLIHQAKQRSLSWMSTKTRRSPKLGQQVCHEIIKHHYVDNKAVLHCVLCSFHPFHKRLIWFWLPPLSRTGCNYCHVLGVLACAQHCSRTAVVASHSHIAHYRKTWRHTQNQTYLKYCNSSRGGLSHTTGNMHREFDAYLYMCFMLPLSAVMQNRWLRVYTDMQMFWSCGICVCFCSFLDDAFRKNLESALRFGNPLLVQDVESYDPILNPVLNRELRRTGGRVLITLGDQDIDLSPSFTIFLSTRDPTVTTIIMQLLCKHLLDSGDCK